MKRAAARRDARGDGCVDIQRSNNFNKSESLPENSKSNYSRSHPQQKTFTVNKAAGMIGARCGRDPAGARQRVLTSMLAKKRRRRRRTLQRK